MIAGVNCIPQKLNSVHDGFISIQAAHALRLPAGLFIFPFAQICQVV